MCKIRYGSGSRTNFDTDPDPGKKDTDPGKKDTDPDPEQGKKGLSIPGKALKCDKKNAQIPCFVCAYYLTISFLLQIII